MISRGTTLIETVLSAALLLLVCLYGLECFGLARRVFVGLKAAHEEDLAAAVALESLRRDAARAGEGLALPIEMGLCAGAETTPGGFVVRCAGGSARPAEDIVAGQTRIALEPGAEFERGQEVCLSGEDRCEIRRVESSGPGWILIDGGAEYGYESGASRVFGVESVTTWLDRPARVLRRRVGGSPGQPLLEDAAAFEVDWDPAGPLARFRLGLNSKRGKLYETSVMPKNLALAPRPAE
jgi:hypothetical protein